jgi:hypothetical protein
MLKAYSIIVVLVLAFVCPFAPISECDAGTVVMDFSYIPAGTSLISWYYGPDTFFLDTSYGFDVIQSGNPDYLGHVGLVATDPLSGNILENLGGSVFSPDSILVAGADPTMVPASIEFFGLHPDGSITSETFNLGSAGGFQKLTFDSSMSNIYHLNWFQTEPFIQFGVLAVDVPNAVPEPSSIVLGLVGAVGCYVIRRRCRAA